MTNPIGVQVLSTNEWISGTGLPSHANGSALWTSTGTLHVNTNAGTTIYVNGTSKGIQTVSGLQLQPGNYSIKFSAVKHHAHPKFMTIVVTSASGAVVLSETVPLSAQVPIYSGSVTTVTANFGR